MEGSHASPGAPAEPIAIPSSVIAAYGLHDAHIELLTGGRTNRTLRVRAGRDVVLQQLHGAHHGDLLGIMENLVRVTAHLDWKRAFADVQRRSWYPELIQTASGKPFIMTEDGDVWRAFTYRTGVILRSAQPLSTLASAAAIFGRFAAETADLDGPPLIETTPRFHDLDWVYDALVADIEDGEGADLAAGVDRRQVRDRLSDLADLKSALDHRCAQDGLRSAPERVVHNDTKLSNVLFDRDHGQAVAVLDLDLVMMGPSWHDLGDLLRSSCWNPPSGPSPSFSPELFDAVVGGFVYAGGPTFSAQELATFAVAGPRLSFELGLRYLHDHLRKTPHLMVHGPNGHLRRGLANVNLAREMLNAYDALRPIVDRYIDDSSRLDQGPS